MGETYRMGGAYRMGRAYRMGGAYRKKASLDCEWKFHCRMGVSQLQLKPKVSGTQ